MDAEKIEQLRAILLEIIEWERKPDAERNSYANKLIRARKAQEFAELACSHETEILSHPELSTLLRKIKHPGELMNVIYTTFRLTDICGWIIQTAKELRRHNIQLYFEPDTKITYLKKADSEGEYPDCILSKTVLL